MTWATLSLEFNPNSFPELISFTCIYKLLELCHLRKPLFPNQTWQSNFVENHSLRLGGANSHPHLFRFTWKPKVSLKLMKVTGPFVKSKAVSTRSALKLPEPERTRGESHSPSGDEPHKSSQQFSIFKSKFCVKQIRYEMIINEFSSCFQADFVIFAQTQGSYCLLCSVFVLD